MPTLMPGPISTNKISQANFRRSDQVGRGGKTRHHRASKHHDISQEPWDRLPSVPLVKNALRELDRQNATLRSVDQDLEKQLSYSSLKQFARHGGPDLSDLRGYNIPTKPLPNNYRVQDSLSAAMVGRGTRRGRGGASRPVLGKRGRDQSVEPVEQEAHRGRGRPRGSRPRQSATGGKPTRGTRNLSPKQRAKEIMSTTTDTEISTQSLTSTKSTTSNAYHSRFRDDLMSYNIIPLNDHNTKKYPEPDNMEEIRKAMQRDRTWAPDFKKKAQEYQEKLCIAMNETQVARLLDLASIPADTTALEKPESNIVAIDLAWKGIEPLSECFKPAKPDLAYATAATDLKKPILDSLGALVLPHKDKHFVCPNFMVSAKGPKGTSGVNDLEAVYVGALAARGMHALWSLSNDAEAVEAKPDTGRIARTLTCTWLAGHFTMYATYRQEQPGAEDRPEGSVSTSSALPTYCTKLVEDWSFKTKDDEKLKKGLGAYLNGLEWAQKQRDEGIERANARYEKDKRAKKIPASDDEDRREGEQRRSVEAEETSDRDEGDDEGSPAHKRSEEDDESHHDEPGDGQDVQQVSWSFNSADSQRTITRSRARGIMMNAGTDVPQSNAQ